MIKDFTVLCHFQVHSCLSTITCGSSLFKTSNTPSNCGTSRLHSHLQCTAFRRTQLHKRKWYENWWRHQPHHHGYVRDKRRSWRQQTLQHSLRERLLLFVRLPIAAVCAHRFKRQSGSRLKACSEFTPSPDWSNERRGEQHHLRINRRHNYFYSLSDTCVAQSNTFLHRRPTFQDNMFRVLSLLSREQPRHHH